MRTPRSQRSPAGYRAALARVHDEGFGGFARDSAPGILALLRRAGVPDGLVVDLGCGSGIWAAELVRAGYSVLGVDQSAAMLAIARERAPAARLRRASFVDAELPRCDAVTALGEVLCYRFDERSGLAALRRVFRRVHAALRPGGVFVFDVAEPGRGARAGAARFVDGGDWSMGVEVEEDRRRRLLTRRIATFVRDGAGWRRDDEVHRLRLYRGVELAGELRALGFRVRLSRGYGALRFPPCYVALLARKPARRATLSDPA